MPVQLARVDLDALKPDEGRARRTLQKLAQTAPTEVTRAVLAQHADRLRRWGKAEAAARLGKLADELLGRAPAAVAPAAE